MFDKNELAKSVFKNKYANGNETVEQMFDRMAGEFSKISKKYGWDNSKEGLSIYGKTREALTKEKVKELFNNFKGIIPQGSILATLGTDKIASLSNCWVVEEPLDSYASILKTDAELVYLYKRRGGVGTGISRLRPAGSVTKNASNTSSGAVSFMHRFSNTTNEVAINGRRGALMLTIDVRHPDVFDFVNIKQDLTKVTGANISVKLNKDFMKKAENNEDYFLRYPVTMEYDDSWKEIAKEYNKLYNVGNNQYIKKIKAKELWDAIIYNAWKSAEPGLIFWDNVLDYDPASVYEEQKPQNPNPCFTGDQKLLTATGYKTFESLEGKELPIVNSEGDFVLGKVFTTGYKKVVEIIAGKDKIKATPDHVFMTLDGKPTLAKDLKGKKIKPYINERHIKDWKVFQLGGVFYFLTKESSIKLLEGRYLKTTKSVNPLMFEPLSFFGNIYIDLKPLLDTFNILPNEFSKNFPTGYFDKLSEESKKDFIAGFVSQHYHNHNKKSIILYVNNKLYFNRIYGLLKKYNVVASENGRMKINVANFKKYIESFGLVVNKELKDKFYNFIYTIVPVVKEIRDIKSYKKVNDFYLYDKIHWGVVNGYVAHNCGEQYLPPYDSCRLIAINLYGVVRDHFTDKAQIDFDKVYKLGYEGIVLGDNLVDLELEYIDRIINKILNDPEPYEVKESELKLWLTAKENIKKGRRIGLGITGLGDMLASIGLKYDSEDALQVVDKVMNTLFKGELDASIDLAIQRGAFEIYDDKKEYNGDLGSNKWYNMLKEISHDAYERMRKYGRRNINFSTVAPTGSVSILAEVTSGVEPLFMYYYIKRNKVMDDGDYDFVDDLGVKWKEFPVIHPKLQEWLKVKGYNPDNISKEKLDELIKESPYYNATANDIDWEKRIKMQAILQKYITNAISSTLNLPSDVSIDTVNNIYKKGFEEGLKGVTIYRDGSRMGVYVKESNKEKDNFDYTPAYKRPEKIKAKVFTQNIVGKSYVVYVGYINDKPYEVFVREGSVEPGNGFIIKKAGGEYYFIRDKENARERIITGKMTPEQELIARLISRALRHGSHYKFIVKDIEKSDVSIFDFPEAIKKVLVKHFTNEDSDEIYGNKCPSCGNDTLVFEEGCKTCKNCGWSAC